MKDVPVQIRSDHNTGDYFPYSYRMVSGFFNVPYYLISNKGYETRPPVYSPYPRRLESLTICRCSYKGSTFSSVILRPWVLVRPETNSRPPAWQPDAQPTEPPAVRSWVQILFSLDIFKLACTCLRCLSNCNNLCNFHFMSIPLFKYMNCMLFAGWEVLIARNSDRGLENAASFFKTEVTVFAIRNEP